jgi:hypothetical protein
VLSLAHSPSYHLLVSAGVDRDAYVWNPYFPVLVTKLVGAFARPEAVRLWYGSRVRLAGHYTSLVSVRAVADTPQIITADTSGVIKIWDVYDARTLLGRCLSVSSHLYTHAGGTICVCRPLRRTVARCPASRRWRLTHSANALWRARTSCTCLSMSLSLLDLD